MRFIVCFGLLLLARVSAAAEPVHYLSVVNDSPLDIQSLEVSAPQASVDGSVTERHPSLRDGETVTFGIHSAGHCMRDLLVTFDNEQRVIVRDLDICTDRVVHARELYVAVLRDSRNRDAATVASINDAGGNVAH